MPKYANGLVDSLNISSSQLFAIILVIDLLT